MFVSSQRNSRR